MLVFAPLCPHGERKFKLSTIGPEARESMQCPYCRGLIKSELAEQEKSNTDKSVFRNLIFGLKASHFPGVKEGDGAMMEIGMKIGDRYKDKSTGKVYVVRMETANGTLCLEGENGLGRRLTGKGSLRQTCEKLEDTTS